MEKINMTGSIHAGLLSGKYGWKRLYAVKSDKKQMTVTKILKTVPARTKRTVLVFLLI